MGFELLGSFDWCCFMFDMLCYDWCYACCATLSGASGVAQLGAMICADGI